MRALADFLSRSASNDRIRFDLLGYNSARGHHRLAIRAPGRRTVRQLIRTKSSTVTGAPAAAKSRAFTSCSIVQIQTPVEKFTELPIVSPPRPSRTQRSPMLENSPITTRPAPGPRNCCRLRYLALWSFRIADKGHDGLAGWEFSRPGLASKIEGLGGKCRPYALNDRNKSRYRLACSRKSYSSSHSLRQLTRRSVPWAMHSSPVSTAPANDSGVTSVASQPDIPFRTMSGSPPIGNAGKASHRRLPPLLR